MWRIQFGLKWSSPLGAGHERSGPTTEGIDRFVEALSPWGQRVPIVVSPMDHAVALKAPEAFGQQIRGDPRQPPDQFVVPTGSVQQLPDDQQRPALADDVQRSSEPAVLTIRRMEPTLT